MLGWRQPGRSCRAPWLHVRVVWVKWVRAEYRDLVGLGPSRVLVGIYLGLRYSFRCFSMVSFEILSSSGVFWNKSSTEMSVRSSGRATGKMSGCTPQSAVLEWSKGLGAFLLLVVVTLRVCPDAMPSPCHFSCVFCLHISVSSPWKDVEDSLGCSHPKYLQLPPSENNVGLAGVNVIPPYREKVTGRKKVFLKAKNFP